MAASNLEPPSHDIVFADQKRHVEPKRADRIGDFTNVRRLILAKLADVQFQRVNRAVLDPERRKDVIAAGTPARFSRFRMPFSWVSA